MTQLSPTLIPSHLLYGSLFVLFFLSIILIQYMMRSKNFVIAAYMHER